MDDTKKKRAEHPPPCHLKPLENMDGGETFWAARKWILTEKNVEKYDGFESILKSIHLLALRPPPLCPSPLRPPPHQRQDTRHQ